MADRRQGPSRAHPPQRDLRPQRGAGVPGERRRDPQEDVVRRRPEDPGLLLPQPDDPEERGATGVQSSAWATYPSGCRGAVAERTVVRMRGRRLGIAGIKGIMGITGITAVALLGLGSVTVPATAAASRTYSPPYSAGPQGGDSNNFISNDPTTGRVTVARAYPSPGAFNCAGKGGFAYDRIRPKV